MTKLDEMIERALRDEDADLVRDLQEKGYFANAFGMFRGPQGWVAWVVMIVQAALFLIGLWCAIRFFGATEVLAALKWGLSAATLMLMATVLKMSLMPQLQAERILREVRRLELVLVGRSEG